MADTVKEEPVDFEEITDPVLPEYYRITDNNQENEDSKCDINLGEISSNDTDEKVDIKHNTEYYQQFLDKKSWDAGEGTSKQCDSDGDDPSGLVKSIKEELNSDNSDMEATNNDEDVDTKSLFEEQLHEVEDSSNMNTASDEDQQERSPSSSTETTGDESDSETRDHTYAARKTREFKHQKCKLCDFKHHKVTKLRQHIEQMHRNVNEIKCKLCDYRTVQMLEMESHINEQHPSHTRTHKCTDCDLRFISVYNLQRHMKFAHKLPQNLCRYCDHYEDSQAKLKRHVEKEHFKSIICEYCGYAASQRSDMVKHHTRMHVGIKRYKCKYCNYAAVFARDLQHHSKRKHVHAKCDICDLTTDRKSLAHHKLLVHNSVTIPSQEVPYKCRNCPFETGESKEYLFHISICNNSVIRCKICDFEAESRLMLNKHIKKVHQGCIEN